MSTMGTIFGREPAAISAVVSLGLKALLVFEVIQWTDIQELALMAFVDAVLLILVVRPNVTPTAAPQLEGGVTVDVKDVGSVTLPEAG